MKQGLTVRPVRAADAECYEQLASESDVFEHDRSEESAILRDGSHVMQRALTGWIEASFFMFAILEDSSIRGFGHIKIVDDQLWIGYWISSAFRNRGLCKHLVAELVRFSADVLKASEISAEVVSDNAASQRVLEKNGFEAFGGHFIRSPTNNVKKKILIYKHIARKYRRPSKVKNLQDIMYEYSHFHNMSPIMLSADGTCRLRFGGDVDVSIEQSRRRDRFHIYATVARISGNRSTHWYIHLLEANLFGRHTGFASVSVDTTSQKVMLCQIVDLDFLTSEKFDAYLREFIESLIELRTYVQTEVLNQASAASDLDLSTMIRI